MTALPPSSDFTGSARTNAEMRLTHAALRAYLAGLLGEDGTPATALKALGAGINDYVAKSSAYTVNLADRGKVLACTGTWTLGLPAVGSAGAGFSVTARNVGSGTITIDPAGAELIEGAATLALAAGRALTLVCTGSTWAALWIPGRAQTGATDTSATALLGPGAFGLGATAAVPLLANIDDAATPSGSWRTDLTSTGTFPTAAQAFCFVRIERYNATNIRQTLAYVGNSGSGDRIWERTYNQSTASWLPWREAYTQRSVVGGVSQSAGVPTGALIERSDSANGSYARWACGTQLCWRVIDDTATAWATATGSGFTRAAALSWTFPAVFSAAPAITGTIQCDAAVGGGVSARTVGIAAAGLQPWATASQAAAMAKSVHVSALGRWF